MQKKDFLNYIHYFRGLAILFIVGLHACVTLRWDEGVMQRKAMIVLFNNGTVLFVFIAGFLFFHLSKDRFVYKDYLRKKLLYVILPYLLVSIPALIDKFYFDKVGEHWWMDESFSSSNPVLKVFLLLSSGRHMGIFWFIPMICIIYLLAPVILRFSKTRSFLYIAPLIFIFGLFTFRFGYYANIILSLEYFLPVYLFGIWVYRIKDYLFKNAGIVILITGCIYVFISLAEFFEWVPFNETIGLRDVKYTLYRFNFNKTKMYIFCIFVLSVFYVWNAKKISFLKLLGDYSFGIFFIHLYVIQVFRLADRAGILRISPPNVFTFILYFIVVVTFSVGIVKFIKILSKDKSRYLIGS